MKNVFKTFSVAYKKNYGGKYLLNGSNISCFTKEQMKSLYPERDFKCIAEYAPGSNKEKTSSLRYGEKDFPLARYKTHNRFVYREKGCVAVDAEEDIYVILLQKVLIPRVLATALCVVLAVGAVMLALNWDKPIVAANSDKTALALDQNAVDWQGAKMNNTGGVAAGIAIPGYKSITVDADKKDVKVNFSNPEGNPCYFVISLLLDDGTVLYQSKMVEPGKGLYDITLAKPLPKGQYNATVKIDTFSLQDLSPMNGAEVKIKLIAQSL